MTKQTTISKDDASNVSANTESPDQKSEQTGTTCMHEGASGLRFKEYERDGQKIAVSYYCDNCGFEAFLFGEQALKDWTENAD